MIFFPAAGVASVIADLFMFCFGLPDVESHVSEPHPPGRRLHISLNMNLRHVKEETLVGPERNKR